jgi:hypothetical protein
MVQLIVEGGQTLSLLDYLDFLNLDRRETKQRRERQKFHGNYVSLTLST